MSQHSTLRSLCVSRIAPVVAALSFIAGAQNASAGDAERAALYAKLKSFSKDFGDAGTTIVKAKSADLIYAVALLLEDKYDATLDQDVDYSTIFDTDAEVAAIVQEALSAQTVGGVPKARADKDKIAGQLVSTAIASRNLSNDSAAATAIVVAAYTANSGNASFALKPTGKAAVLAAGLKSVSQDTAIGQAIGSAISAVTQPVDTQLLLTNTSKSLGKSAGAASTAFAGLVQSLVEGNDASSSVINAAALSVAGSVPAAAGAIYGGFAHAQNAVNGNAPFTDAGLKGLASSIVDNPKFAKAYGEILANVLSDYNEGAGTFGAVTTELLGLGTTGTPQAKGLVAQGMIRAGGSAQVDEVLTSALTGVTTASQIAAFGGVVAANNGTNGSIDEITNKLVTAAGAVSLTDKININTAIVNGVGATAPDAAKTATETTIGVVGATNAMTLALSSVAKIKVTAAAGAMAAAVVESTLDTNNTNTADQDVTLAATNSALIMAKGAKSATDIARSVASIDGFSAFTPTATEDFAERIADANKKFVLNAAVGVSVADTANTPEITLAAITHDVVNDKAAIGQTAKIAGAVATAVDVEQSSRLGRALANSMSDKGLGTNQPLKLSNLNAMATAIAKAIQSKANVKTFNRADELGELGAFLVANILGKYSTPTAELNAIKSLGSTLFKALNVKNLNDWRTLKADRGFWFDIVGSIALTIKAANLPQSASLIAADGVLETTFAKLAGADAQKIKNTFALIRSGGGTAEFESGLENNEAIINDPETDMKDSFQLGKTL